MNKVLTFFVFRVHPLNVAVGVLYFVCYVSFVRLY
jgi:hypothetical protein